jgi:hypothetical protein
MHAHAAAQTTSCVPIAVVLSSTQQREKIMDDESTSADLIITATLAVSLVIAVIFIANLIGAIHVYG